MIFNWPEMQYREQCAIRQAEFHRGTLQPLIKIAGKTIHGITSVSFLRGVSRDLDTVDIAYQIFSKSYFFSINSVDIAHRSLQ